MNLIKIAFIVFLALVSRPTKYRIDFIIVGVDYSVSFLFRNFWNEMAWQNNSNFLSYSCLVETEIHPDVGRSFVIHSSPFFWTWKIEEPSYEIELRFFSVRFWDLFLLSISACTSASKLPKVMTDFVLDTGYITEID